MEYTGSNKKSQQELSISQSCRSQGYGMRRLLRSNTSPNGLVFDLRQIKRRAISKYLRIHRGYGSYF